VKSIESIAASGGTPVKIEFPLVSDDDFAISNKYGMLVQEGGKTFDRRTVFIINEENKIMAMFNYPNVVGRNIEEIKRTLIALQTSEKYEVMTPEGWIPGDEVLIHSPATVSDAEKLSAKMDPNLRQVAWYMWFRRL
jgi:peroxiredoxin (alkyl hydroperoxide reductase subunit C)